MGFHNLQNYCISENANNFKDQDANFIEMDFEQRRQLIDNQPVFATWWPAKLECDRLPSLVWKTSKGH